VIRHIVRSIAGEESGENQVPLVSIDILVGVPVDKTTMHAAIGVQIYHKVNLIGLDGMFQIERLRIK